MKRLITIILITSYLGYLAASEPLTIGEKDYSGIYETQGTIQEEDGPVKYSGITIIQKKGDGYRFQQTGGPGLNTYGVALINDGVLVASWKDQSGQPGISRFEIKGKEMTGKWMLFVSMQFHEENLTYKMPFPRKKE